MVGKSLGHYEILDPLGSGGMGDVYRAHDSSLNRDVAIKVLSKDLADDPDLLSRLEREAYLLAALNHPNIATIHALEETDTTRFLVMELVKGESLEQRLAGGALPVDEALDICRQIAEALEAAHEEGIIHRDLKPSNVMITPEGRAKVLDFGLAKTVATATPDVRMSRSPTLAVVDTQAGMILGTAPYMSPEQARGKPLDKRTDIWAFGCVLYEALTGRSAFTRETVVDTLAAILEDDPPWDALPNATSGAVHAVLRRCLRKDPKRRLRDIGDARLEFEEAAEPASAQLGPQIAVPEKDWTRTTRAVAVAIVALSMIAAGLMVQRLMLPGPNLVSRWVIELPTELASGWRGFALSPDGRHIVWVGGEGDDTFLYHRPIDRFTSIVIPDTEGALRPFFSPDGQWVGFQAEAELMKVRLDGSDRTTICFDCAGSQPAWSPGGESIAFVKDGAVWLVSSAGGEPTIVARPGDHDVHSFGRPAYLPDGDALVLEARLSPRRESFGVALLDLTSGGLSVLLRRGYAPQYVPTGHILYGDGTRTFALPFDLDARVPVAEAVPVLEDTSELLVSRNGTLALVIARAVADDGRRLVWVDRTGNETVASAAMPGLSTPRLSPDGTRVAVVVEDRIWIYDLGAQTLQILPQPDDANRHPVWVNGGQEIVFASGTMATRNVFGVAADGSESARSVRVTENPVVPLDWAPGSGELVLYELGGMGKRNILIFPLAQGGDPVDFKSTNANERGAALSPDGRWLAYSSDVSGQDEVYVEPYPSGGPQTLVSNNGGGQPRWNPSGGELFYVSSGRLVSIAVTLDPKFEIRPGERRELFDTSDYLTSAHRALYEVAPDGERFLMVKGSPSPADGDVNNRIYVVENWLEELKRLVPTGW